jgi:hypothetical protein
VNRFAIFSAALGALAWALVPLAATPLALGSLEHTFLFAPLVATPLALAVLGSLCGSQTLVRFQPVAASFVLMSFLDAKGPRAGALAIPWVLLAVALLADAVRRPAARNPSRIAAHVFLIVAAVWLALFRIGMGPAGLPPLRVFLGTTHFHFSGFLLQVLISAAAHRLRDVAPRLVSLQRGVAIGAIVAIVALALGNLLALPIVRFIGVACMVASTLVLAFTSTHLALATRAAARRALLGISAASLVAGMLLALVYGVGELTGQGWIALESMVPLHGFLNAFGFTLCGLLGHLVARRSTFERPSAKRATPGTGAPRTPL